MKYISIVQIAIEKSYSDKLRHRSTLSVIAMSLYSFSLPSVGSRMSSVGWHYSLVSYLY